MRAKKPTAPPADELSASTTFEDAFFATMAVAQCLSPNGHTKAAFRNGKQAQNSV
jgi:hypothetical protein